ncbi:extracellular solute-binding protein family 5 (plasmid) [Halorhabdus tiamatea SARL4B]|nr:extracellular solute-binding protein family 5 [Halorhabdus tiamatea SARL4B]
MQVDRLQRWNISTGEFTEYAMSIDEYERSNERAVLEVRDGLTWHNGDPGDPVSAEDLQAFFVCNEIANETVAGLYDSTGIEILDDRRLELPLSGKVNERIFRQSMNNWDLDTPYRRYGDFVERYLDASDDEEINSVRSDLRSAEFEEPHGNGPFKFVEKTSSRYRMERYDHHPDAENINFQYWDVNKVSTDTNSVVLNMFPDGDVDMIRNYNAPPTVWEQRDDDHLNTQLPALWGQALTFNCEHDDYGSVRVRQAIAELIDRDLVARNYGQWGQPVQAPSGIVGNIAGDNSPSERWKDWVTEEGAEALHRYDDPERGRRLLREEGYEKVDGQWKRSDGSQLSIDIKVPADYSDWQPIFDTVVNILDEEGISANKNLIDSTSYYPDHYLEGNYVAASTGWTLGRDNPFYTFGQWFRPLADRVYKMNFGPEDVVAPPFGEPDGELQEWDVQELFANVRTAEGDELYEAVEQFAWVANQFVPMLPLIEINDVTWQTADDWDWPDPDDEAWQAKWPQWWLPRQGLMGAKDDDEAA